MNDLFFDWSGDDTNVWDAANLTNGKQRLVHMPPAYDPYGMAGAPEYDPAYAAQIEPDALLSYIAELEAERQAAAYAPYAPAPYDPYRAPIERYTPPAPVYTPAPTPSEQDESILARLLGLLS